MKNHKYLDNTDIIYNHGDLYHIFLCEDSKYYRSKIDYYLGSKTYVDQNNIKNILLVNRTDREDVLISDKNLDIRDPTKNEVLLWFNSYLKYINSENELIKQSIIILKDYIKMTLYDVSKSLETKESLVSDNYFLIKELMDQDKEFSKLLEKFKDLFDNYTVI